MSIEESILDILAMASREGLEIEVMRLSAPLFDRLKTDFGTRADNFWDPSTPNQMRFPGPSTFILVYKEFAEKLQFPILVSPNE